MKKSYLLVLLLTPFCIWAVAGASDPPKKALNPAESGAEQQILADENLIAFALAERPDGDLILSEECPLGYSIFGQVPPSPFDSWIGWDSDIATGATHFDNFWNLSSDICSITWWGFDIAFDGGVIDCTEDPMDFEVAFYPDDGSGRPDTRNPIYTLPSVTPIRIPTGQWYGPTGGVWTELNRYHLELDPCVTATEGWISIQGISYGGDPQDCWYFWINSNQGDDILWRLEPGGWSQFAQDQAFCLGGSEYYATYGACCNLSTGDCQDNVEYQDCPQEGFRFEADVSCAELDPPCGSLCEEFEYSLNTFTNYEAGDPAGWHWTRQQGVPPGSAFHDDDNVVDGCDDWLISPGNFSLSPSGSSTLTWDQRGLFSEYCDYHGVLISSDYVNGSDPTTATWTELYTGSACEDCWESITVELSDFAGQTVHFAFRYRGDYSDQWWVDNVCVDDVTIGPSCTYIPGDCDHNGTALELPDVMAMIGIYRGTVEPYYTCDCPPHGDIFAAEADPNGNCITLELADVVTEIGAYRGTAEAAGCPDCPGSLRLMPGADSPASSGIPSLSTKVKSKAGSITR